MAGSASTSSWDVMDGICPSPSEAAVAAKNSGSKPGVFLGTLDETFETAARAAGGAIERFYRVGPSLVRLRFAGPELISQITPALAHLEASESSPVSLTICVFDSRSTGTKMPPPPWTKDCYGPRGEIQGYNSASMHVVYGPGTDILRVLDWRLATAFYWVPDAGAIPYWETSFPFRTMFHWWFRDQPCQPVHAGAVGTLDGGVLIAGRSGSGKSTTTLACLDSDLCYAGDDYVVAQAEPEPYVYSLYCTAKLERHNVWRLPHLAPLITNANQPDQEKALIFLSELYPHKLARGFPIRAILVPKITGRRDTKVAPCGRAACLVALAPSTVIHLPGAGAGTMSKLGALARRVPAFQLELGTDLSQIPRVISELLRGYPA